LKNKIATLCPTKTSISVAVFEATEYKFLCYVEISKFLSATLNTDIL